MRHNSGFLSLTERFLYYYYSIMEEIARLVPQSGTEEDVLRIDMCVSTGEKV